MRNPFTYFVYIYAIKERCWGFRNISFTSTDGEA